MIRLGRMPIRVRVTLAFAGALALVLAATGLFVVLRMGAELDQAIEQGLRSRAADVAALAGDSDSGLQARRALDDDPENQAQVLNGAGDVVDATPGVPRIPLLNDAELARAQRDVLLVDREHVPGTDEPARLLAIPLRGDGRRLVVVVVAALDDRRDSLASLAQALLIGGAAALLVASLVGYGAVAAALWPVERMRRRAAAIRSPAPSERLPVPDAHDEIGRLGETLNDMLARLEAAFIRERAFVADAGHELRTPLAILKAELELARRSGRSVEELRAALESAAEETDRLVQLAEDLLVIARSDQGRLPIREEAIPADELLNAVRARYAGRAESLGATIAVEPADGVVLLADPLRLEQALGNLVDNALLHGGGAIELDVVAGDDDVCLRVRDDGPGFPPEFIDSAFERFTRADSARSRGGAGLGLAIVAVVASAHGGRVGARNRAEGGAEVWLEVPRAPSDAVVSEPLRSPARRPGS